MARLSILGTKLLLKTWGEVVSKAKRGVSWKSINYMVFQITEILLGVELVEYPFNVQKDGEFHEHPVNQGYVPQSHTTSKQTIL